MLNRTACALGRTPHAGIQQTRQGHPKIPVLTSPVASGTHLGMKKLPTMRIWRENPPGPRSKVEVEYRTRGRTYKREVGPNGYLSSTEACAYLEVSLRWLYRLVADGRLRPKRESGQLWFRLQDLRRIEAARQQRGRRPKRDLWLAG